MGNGGPVVIDGMIACASSPVWLSTLPGVPRAVPRNPLVPKMPEPLFAIGLPKPILNAHRTQTISVTLNATNASIMLFTDQRFLHHTAVQDGQAGEAHQPHDVAAVICHALSPALSQDG